MVSIVAVVAGSPARVSKNPRSGDGPREKPNQNADVPLKREVGEPRRRAVFGSGPAVGVDQWLIPARELLADEGYASVALTLDAGALDPYEDPSVLARQVGFKDLHPPGERFGSFGLPRLEPPHQLGVEPRRVDVEPVGQLVRPLGPGAGLDNDFKSRFREGGNDHGNKRNTPLPRIRFFRNTNNHEAVPFRAWNFKDPLPSRESK